VSSLHRNSVSPSIGPVLFGLLAVAVVATPARTQAQDQNQANKDKGMVKVVELNTKPARVVLSNGDAELIIVHGVGPRVSSYRALPKGKNVFKVFEENYSDPAPSPDKWLPYGGHRLWAGPEDTTRTYAPDNAPAEYEKRGEDTVVVRSRPDQPYGIQREMLITLAKTGTEVTVIHRIKNVGDQPTTLNVWCLSVMAPGGTEVIPMPAGRPHPGPPENARGPEDFASDRLLVLWPFFDFTDPRWSFGSRFIQLRQDTTRGPTKIGVANRQGWVAYLNEGTAFVKMFDYEKGKTYPDGGCNFETFTNQDMLEVESLGPLTTLQPGETAEHTERWMLLPDIGALPNEGAIERELMPRLAR
jgi:hypothetical protein